ncbi:MAG: hypothetical protein BM564_12385 [Bacteroidetes bacterium MedPE-SWsnd-G2]|nr:MAG: hypothetical protein BM564_12385 [Bacteroidetes bacterium MedPE-SWsnd-G2]
MFKLFNALRFQFLSKNKISKYLLYALGEIILVVIGILIALNINNANQLKLQKEKEVKLLTELKYDLEITLEELKRDIQYLNIQIERGETLISVFIDSTKAPENAIDFNSDYAGYTNNVKSYPRTMAYQNLKSLGVDLFSNDSIRFLMTEIFERKIERLQHWQKSVINREESLFTNHAQHLKLSKNRTEENWYDLIPKSLERTTENMAFINEFAMMQDQRHVLWFVLTDLESEVKHLLNVIEDEQLLN